MQRREIVSGVSSKIQTNKWEYPILTKDEDYSVTHMPPNLFVDWLNCDSVFDLTPAGPQKEKSPNAFHWTNFVHANTIQGSQKVQNNIK